MLRHEQGRRPVRGVLRCPSGISNIRFRGCGRGETHLALGPRQGALAALFLGLLGVLKELLVPADAAPDTLPRTPPHRDNQQPATGDRTRRTLDASPERRSVDRTRRIGSVCARLSTACPAARTATGQRNGT